ncbi:WD40 repeat-like protein [Schizophyllum commune H4-8]|uniref:WD40 repeat-like protein n=1 Tax=Schizophyllum commune (strain H4-8 / FGSC 9210) TaxID=578458 RepID=UPI00215F4498|nr:WD40 repeat-like protein [Schizophyllum commune H4-8]KAI5892000.1 WD40 repeat-like protein [Schizophyllum commune H4-8]
MATTDRDPDRYYEYIIHRVPGRDSIQPSLSSGLKKGRRFRRFTIMFAIDEGDYHECDSTWDTELHIAAHNASLLRIWLRGEHSKEEGEYLAWKVCDVNLLLSASEPIIEELNIYNQSMSERPQVALTISCKRLEDLTADELSARFSFLRKWAKIDTYTRRVVDVGQAVAELNPVSKAVLALVKIGSNELSNKLANNRAILALIDGICEAIQQDNADDPEFQDQSQQQIRAREVLMKHICTALTFVHSLSDAGTRRILSEKTRKRVEELHEKILTSRHGVETARHIDTQTSVFRSETLLVTQRLLEHLPYAPHVQPGSSKRCQPGTRVILLDEIVDWAYSPNSTRGFLLSGAAGTGKSAIANSVAENLASRGVFAPFFAFDRSSQDRKAHQLYPTLAAYLLCRCKRYQQALRTQEANRLVTRDIQDQYTRLFDEPIRAHTILEPVVIVIDALDECPDAGNDGLLRRVLLETLRTCLLDDQLPRNIRILITARPDKDIQSVLMHKNTALAERPIHNVEGTKDDIRAFVKKKLEGEEAAELADEVATASQSLFECAATLCRELTGVNRPKTIQLRHDLVQRVLHSGGRALYESYRGILEAHLDVDSMACMSSYRQLLACIFAVRTPQTRAVLQEIAAGLQSTNDIMDILKGLGSLLTGTTANGYDPIRPLHTSFRDFVLDAEASGPFAITSEFAAADSQLALACFGIMGRPKSGLRYNICDLPSPFVYKKDVENLDELLSKHVSLGLRYACREVSVHLSHSRLDSKDLVTALMAFLQGPFLFWLEACGWLGYEPCDVLQDMLEWVKIHDSNGSKPLVSDFISFAKRFRNAISTSPPQVYITGMLFAPNNSHVSRLYRPCVSTPMDISGYEPEREWPPSETLVIQDSACNPSIAFSPDGAKIIAGDHELRIWDAETGRQIGSAMRGHERLVCSVAFSPDGSTIASGSYDCTVRLWNANTGQQQGEALRGHTDCVQSVAFSPDGAAVVSASEDCTLRLWDAKAGKEIGEAMEGHSSCVRSVVFSHDGARIVSSADDRTIRIWDTAARQQLGNPIWHEDELRSVSISRDGKYVASGSHDGTVRVWDEGGRQQVWASHGHTDRVCAVAFSSDSTRIVSGGQDDTVRIWDAASGEQVGDELRGHAGYVSTVAFSPDEKRIASSYYDEIWVWDVREAKKESNIPVRHTTWITSVACSPDGKYIVSGSYQTVRLWNVQTGQPVGDLMTGHNDEVNCVTFSPDSTRVAIASDDRKVRVWDVETQLPVGVLEGHDRPALCVAFSPDGTRLVSGSVDETLRLWDLATGQQIGEPLYGHKSWVESVSFSSDGLYIASGSADRSIRLWDAKSQLQRRGALEGHQDHVLSLALSSDEVYLVAGSSDVDTAIHLWDVKTGEQKPLTGHTDRVPSVSFSLDGKYVVSGSRDGTVRVWSVQTGQQVGVTLRGHEAGVSVTFSFDSCHIVSGSWDGTIRVWDFGKLQRLENTVDAASTDTTRACAQAALRKGSTIPWNGCMVYDDFDGSERPLIWIPHHLRHYRHITSLYQIQFVPPAPHIRITLNDLFRLNEWPTYTPAPAPMEPLEALGLEE